MRRQQCVNCVDSVFRWLHVAHKLAQSTHRQAQEASLCRGIHAASSALSKANRPKSKCNLTTGFNLFIVKIKHAWSCTSAPTYVVMAGCLAIEREGTSYSISITRERGKAMHVMRICVHHHHHYHHLLYAGYLHLYSRDKLCP